MLTPSIFGEDLFDEMMRFPFEQEFFGRPHSGYRKASDLLMRTDVKETEGGYEMDVDLPGFKKDDISVKLENGYLTIQAAKKEKHEEKNAEGKYIRQERYSGSCQRSFYVGENVTQEDVKCRFEDGILKLTLPKDESEKIEESKYIAIEG